MKLYNIKQAFYDWQEKLVETEGELTPELMDELNNIQVDTDEKLESFGCIIKSCLADAEAIKQEKKNLEIRQKRLENIAESVENKLDETMQFFGKDKFSTPKVAISYRKSNKVSITNEDLIPIEYFKIKKEVSKADISLAIKNGKVIEGAEMVLGQNIQIK